MDLVRKGFAHYVPWDLDREQGLVRLREPGSKAAAMEFPQKTDAGVRRCGGGGGFGADLGSIGAIQHGNFEQIRTTFLIAPSLSPPDTK